LRPEYYRWNQWFFVQMFKKGLAFRKKSAVNWCRNARRFSQRAGARRPLLALATRWSHRKELNPMVFQITQYADRLLERF